MSDFVARLKKFSNEFNAKLPELFIYPEGRERRVSEAMYYSLANGGKRLRPFLVTATAKLFGVLPEQSFITAAALECLHTYSLIHDDLPAMDNDDLRRGKPTCHKQYDEATAILAGDGLLTYAFELISSAQNKIDTDIKCALVQLLAKSSGAFEGMIAGQMLDLDTERSEGAKKPEYVVEHIEEMKTGKLLCFACEAGALLGKANEKEYRALYNYARKIGVAFQISDDILDVEGDEQLMGKTLGKDVAQGKLTFVSLYGLEQAKKKAQILITEAKNELNIFEHPTDLYDLADFIIERRN